MLRRRVRRRERAWGRRRDRAVVDDPTASRHLPLHQPERLLRAEERSGEVGVDDRPPLLDAELLERNRRGADARVVEEQVEPAVAVVDLGEERPDRGRIGDVAGDRDGAVPGRRGGGFERLEAPPREDDRPAVVGEGDGDRGADAAAGSGDECDPRHGRAAHCLLRATRSKPPIIGRPKRPTQCRRATGDEIAKAPARRVCRGFRRSAVTDRRRPVRHWTLFRCRSLHHGRPS